MKKYVTDFANPKSVNMDNTIVIPHLGASTGESEDNCAKMAVQEIMDYLEHNYMNKIQMKDIAEEIHLCESECSRLFKRYMNVSLFTFLQEYRVERSLEFLLSSDDSIMEVAQKSGFTDSNYYAKVFSRVKGCSPQKYRKQNIKKDM